MYLRRIIILDFSELFLPQHSNSNTKEVFLSTMMNPYNYTTANDLFLYSVNSYLSYYINEKYYEGNHYVWCASSFNGNINPPSSNPKDIYAAYKEDIRRNDKHSAQIKQNKLGILKGADAMFESGKITQDEKDDIIFLTNEADITDFTPVIYIIDKNIIDKKIKKPSLTEKAGKFSDEYQIYDLHTDEFDVIHI